MALAFVFANVDAGAGCFWHVGSNVNGSPQLWEPPLVFRKVSGLLEGSFGVFVAGYHLVKISLPARVMRKT